MDTVLIVVIVVLAVIGAGFGWIVFNHSKATTALAKATAVANAVKAPTPPATTPPAK